MTPLVSDQAASTSAYLHIHASAHPKLSHHLIGINIGPLIQG